MHPLATHCLKTPTDRENSQTGTMQRMGITAKNGYLETRFSVVMCVNSNTKVMLVSLGLVIWDLVTFESQEAYLCH